MGETRTSFRVAARTIFHLGAELISSDAIAFYELIKNAFDAGSPTVEVDVRVRIAADAVALVRELLKLQDRQGESARESVDPDEAANVREWLAEAFLPDAPNVADLQKRVAAARTYGDFTELLDDANDIIIRDQGHGMSLDDLRDIYLTIGTPMRKRQREANKGRRPVLGEKGVGRLSAMRLGDRLQVRTATRSDDCWNSLTIDWRAFDTDDDALIESVVVESQRNTSQAKSGSEQGTILTIRGLRSAWSAKVLEDEIGREVARMMDPFAAEAAFPVTLRFNGKEVVIKRLDRLLFPHANMRFTARFERSSRGGLVMGGCLAFCDAKKGVDRSERLSVGAETLLNAVMPEEPGNFDEDYASAALDSLGGFAVELYWFNRQQLHAVDGIGDRKRVRELVNAWAGGLMVYRDGFRVGDYGGVGDDWLGLDKFALSRSGYKFNKAQFIGKVDISFDENPRLLDQTNREGLRDNKEKNALIRLLRWVITTYLWEKTNAWVKAATPVEPERVVRKRLENAKDAVGKIETSIVGLTSTLSEEHDLGAVDTALKAALVGLHEVREAVQEAQLFVARSASDRSEVIHLAGIGLLLEIIAHELARPVGNALPAIIRARKATSGRLLKTLVVLEAALRTIDKRLRLLDPLSISGRQRKESFDVLEWVAEIVDAHSEQLEARGIDIRMESSGRSWPVKMVKGMLLQILENLLNNSIYWLGRTPMRKRGDDYVPRIDILMDPKARTIKVIDNGPGIDEERIQDVFNAFYHERPDGEASRGLGLYIAREVAGSINATLRLTPEPVVHPGRLNSFVLTLEGK